MFGSFGCWKKAMDSLHWLRHVEGDFFIGGLSITITERKKVMVKQIPTMSIRFIVL